MQLTPLDLDQAGGAFLLILASRLHDTLTQPANGARRSTRCSAGEGVASASNSPGTTPFNPASRAGPDNNSTGPGTRILARAGLLATRVPRLAVALVPVARGTLEHARARSRRVAGNQGGVLPWGNMGPAVPRCKLTPLDHRTAVGAFSCAIEPGVSGEYTLGDTPLILVRIEGMSRPDSGFE